ncbi:zinc finger BED domain-containing protein 4-like [Maniola jurtina]|uniref:zinc finger BED domain-containing protein 4-like n=1 Tax=Maniola jurtina TaxID=191418 RepID=UPI001E68A5A8|nr:zinc finger BED domain-containing protein 4-like [Maniola jurtina]
MAVTSTTFDVYKTKIKDIYITPMKNLSTKHTHSFCWTEFGQLAVELNGKRRNVLGEQVFCAVCLRNAKTEDEDVLFSKVQVKAYSKSIATSNLLRHLKDAHGLEDTQKSQISNITEFFSPRTPKTRDKYGGSSKKCDKKSLSQDLALWFARSLIPFDTVDNDAMIDFFKKYNIIVSEADLPSRHNIAREGLEDVYNSMLNYINVFISKQSSRFGALTADMWTDKYRRRNYITCTYHFISEDMTLIKFTLATKEIIMKNTGETIRDEILEVLRSFKIEKKEIYLVTDAGSNMKRAANLLGFDNHLCLGHALHNLVNVNGIENTREIAKILKKCKKIVKHVRYRAPRVEAAASAVQQELLSSIEEFQEFTEHLEDDDSNDSESESTEIPETPERASSSRQHLLPPPTIKTSTSTRWHSILMMLKSISNYANRQPINIILTEIGRSGLVLQDAEHETIEALIKFLENFKKIVEVLSAETRPTLNLVLVFRSEVKRLLEEASDDEPLVISRLKNNMLEGLESRFPLTDVVVAATLLDCRFHSINEINEYMQTKEVTKVSFLSSMIKHRLATEDIQQIPVIDSSKAGQSSFDSTSNFLLDLARRHSTTQRDSESAIENECWKYFSTACPEDLEPYGGDVLQYWKDRKTSMPSLYTLARSILNIPATSTPSERVFSTAGLVITAKRSRLNPLRLNRIIFVHDNYRFCKESIK